MKVNKKIILTLFITLLTIFCISGKVEAAYSATSKTVKSGANVSITIKSTEKLENFDVAYTDAGGLTYKSCSTSVTGAIANSKNGKISYALYGGQATTLGTYTFTAPKVTKETKYTVKFLVNDVTVTSTITVQPEKTDNGGSSNNSGGNSGSNNNAGTTTTKPATKSTNAYLSTLGVTPKEYDFTNFKQSNLTYNVTIPYEVDELKVLYKTAHSKATVKVTGNSGFVVGSNNKITVKVTAEDGKTTKTYTIKVTKLAEVEEKPGNIIDDEEEGIYLTSLKIKGIELSPEFSKDIYAYTAKLSKNLTEVQIDAKANKENVDIEVSGNTNLVMGENTINIVLKQDDSTTQMVYQITLTKEATLVTTTGEETNFVTNLIDNIKNYVIIAVIVVVLIIAAIVILIILLRKENKKIKNKETEEYNVFENNENEFENNQVEETVEEVTEKPKKEKVTKETETKNVGRKTRRKEKGRHSK